MTSRLPSPSPQPAWSHAAAAGVLLLAVLFGGFWVMGWFAARPAPGVRDVPDLQGSLSGYSCTTVHDRWTKLSQIATGSSAVPSASPAAPPGGMRAELRALSIDCWFPFVYGMAFLLILLKSKLGCRYGNEAVARPGGGGWAEDGGSPSPLFFRLFSIATAAVLITCVADLVETRILLSEAISFCSDMQIASPGRIAAASVLTSLKILFLYLSLVLTILCAYFGHAAHPLRRSRDTGTP